MNVYRDRRDTAVTFFILGGLAGMIFAFASCTPTTDVRDGKVHCVENCHE